MRTGITFASWPKWRLFGFESDPEGSLTVNLGRIEQPSELVVNYEVIKPEGCVRAQVQVDSDAKVHTLEDSLPLTGDSVGAKLAWSTGTVIPATEKATVTLHLENARVYAYEIRPAR
jgi:hypothetical protein